MELKPFFCYYGGKWRVARKYPPPRYDTIIEPFAGAAGYSTRYPDKQVILYDSNPVICGLWDYLIRVPSREILRLPLEVQHVDELRVSQEAKWLIGFWLNSATSSPRKQPSAWAKSGIRPNCYWGEFVRGKIARQVESIRHWRVVCGDYRRSGEKRATWFVDPPYQQPGGRHYQHQVGDYGELGDWCRGRQGQVIVCEQEGADWLPFWPFRVIKTNQGPRGKKVSHEVIWTNEGDKRKCLWE